MTLTLAQLGKISEGDQAHRLQAKRAGLCGLFLWTFEVILKC